MVPIELRTARRKKGLQQVSPMISACALKAAQLRASAPRFSALDRLSTAVNNQGRELFSRISASDLCAGIFPTPSKPWYIEKPVRPSNSFFSAT